MTDFKPYAHSRTSSVPPPVAVLAASFVADDQQAEQWLEPIANDSLLSLVLQLLSASEEPSARVLFCTSEKAARWFSSFPSERVELVLDSPDRFLEKSSGYSHLLLIDPRYPLLRSETIDELVRSLLVRPDMGWQQAAVRLDAAVVVDAEGRRCRPSSPESRAAVPCYRLTEAFSLRPWRTPRGTRPEPRPFEISRTEAFLVDSGLERTMAAAVVGR